MKAAGIITGPGNPRTIETKYGKKNLIELTFLDDTMQDPCTLTTWNPSAEQQTVFANLKRGQRIAFDVKSISEYNSRANCEAVEGSLKIT